MKDYCVRTNPEDSIITFSIEATCRFDWNEICENLSFRNCENFAAFISEMIRDIPDFTTDCLSISKINVSEECVKMLEQYKQDKKEEENQKILKEIAELDKRKKELEARLK